MKDRAWRAAEVLRRLKKKYREAMHTSLSHETPWEMMVATILSAQSQDRQVNKITGRLFKRYRNVKDYSGLRPRELYPYVRSVNFYRNKAKNIVNAAKMLQTDFGSKVPRSIEELMELPGVGRKTANVVMSSAFGMNEGMAIDTHCITVANRLGLVRTKDPAKIEGALVKLMPQKDWSNVSHLFIALGRDVCTARAKHCERCVLNDICPSSTAKP